MNILNEKIRNGCKKRFVCDGKIEMKAGLKSSLLILLIFACFGMVIQSLIQNGFVTRMHFIYLGYPKVLCFNILPVFLVMMLAYFVFGTIWGGVLTAYLPLVIMNIVNYFKTLFRDEPLKMSDMRLIYEAKNIIHNYELKISVGLVIGVFFAVAAVYFAVKHIKTEKIGVKIKIIGCVVTICSMILSYELIYTNKQLYENMPTYATKYYDTSVTKHNGFLYSFLVSGATSGYRKPVGYSDEAAKQILEETEIGGIKSATENINVIAIMGEAFFDVTRGGNARFVNDVNPYENYHRLQAEGYFGKLIVPGYGGATETAEFEFLTGTNLYLLDESMPTAYKTFVNKPVYSLVRYFKDLGYYAEAIHPGHSWFYNRKNAYEYLGFDKFTASEDMDEDALDIRGYITDAYTTEQILSKYLEHYDSNPDMPYFNFTITIQNHGPYDDTDYGRDVIYMRTEDMTDENYWIVNNYLNGIADTDKLLGDVCDFAAQRDEPVIVLFFGDHLPYLNDKIECFDALGYNISHKDDEGLENKYKVEYLIYGNDSAKKVIEKNCGKVKYGEGNEISSNFLGTELLEYMGMGKSAYFEFVNSLKNNVNVISPNYYKIENVKSNILEEETEKQINDYKILQYYNLKRYLK